MRFYKNYTKVVAIIEKAAGNESIGDMWFEARTFPKEAPIEDIVKWAENKDCSGKLIIAIDENT